MAIVDMKGTVSKDKPTMTGMMNESPEVVDAPKLSGMNKLFNNRQPVAAPVKEDAPMQETAQAPSNDLISRVQNLPDEDKAVLSTVLSPSVSKVLRKIAPDLNPLLTQFTKEEENVVLPVSIVKNFASRKYPGTEQESIQSFVSDLAGQMEQETTVPPDTQMVQAPESDVNYDAIDSEAMPVT